MITAFRQSESDFDILFKNAKRISLFFLKFKSTKYKNQMMKVKEMEGWEMNPLVRCSCASMKKRVQPQHPLKGLAQHKCRHQVSTSGLPEHIHTHTEKWEEDSKLVLFGDWVIEFS